MRISWLTSAIKGVIGLQTSSTDRTPAQGQPNNEDQQLITKYDFPKRYLKKSHAILVKYGTSDEKLTPAILNVYTNARIMLEKDRLDLGYLTSWAKLLINKSVTPSKLDIFCDAITYNLQKDLVNNSHIFISGFFQLVEEIYSLEEWELYKNLINYHKSIGLPLDGLTHSFLDLVQAKPTNKQLQVYKDLIALFKERNEDLSDVTQGFASLVKANPSFELLEAYKDAVAYYLKVNADIANLTSYFIDLIETKLQAEQWKLYKDEVTKHKEKKFLLNSLTHGFVQVVKTGASFEELKVFCDEVEQDLEGQLAKLFCQLIQAKLSEEEWGLYKDEVDYLTKHDLFSPSFTEAFYRLIQAKPSKEEWKLYKDLLSCHKEKNLGLYDLTDCFAEFVKEKISPLTFEVFKNFILFHLKSGDFSLYNGYNFSTNHSPPSIKALCRYLKEQNASPIMLNNYILAVTGGHLKSIEESKKLLVNITVQSAIANLVRTDSEEVAKSAQQVIEDVIVPDPIPYPLKLDKAGIIPNPKAQKMYEEIISIYRRILNSYYGFSSLTFDTKRPPTKEPPFITRFGKNVAHSVKYLYAKDPTLFPGKGFVISKPILEKIFAPDIEAKAKGKDPFHKYRTQWPWAKEIFYDFPKTHFIFTRGFMAFSCSDKKYELENLDGKKINYSLVIFNNHHHNYGCDVALLVPSQALANKLKGTTIKYEDYPAVPKDTKDINEVGLTPQGLINEAKAMRAKVLNIGWGSNVGGGFCNADEPDSAPLHEWEKERRAQSHTQDFYRHVHKSHITGSYLPSSTDQQENLMIPFRKRHEQLFEITDRYLKLRDLFYRSIAFGHKGLTARKPLFNIDMDDENVFEKLDELRTEQIPEEGEINDLSDNPNLLIILEEAYKWNKGREMGNNNKKDFPIFAVAKDRDRWSRPESPFYLDTFDLTLTINGKRIPLDPNGIGDIERKIWHSKILPEIMHSSKDIRPYDRGDLGIN